MAMTFSLFLQGLINGLNQGAIYALIALGYTMVYGIIRMINFAHGDFIMIGSYTLFYTIPLMIRAGMPAWLAVIIAIVVCSVVGVLVEIIAYRPVRKAGPMSALITALAMSLFLENLAMVLFGAKPHNVQAVFTLPTVKFFGVSLPLNVLLTILIGLLMMIFLQLFVKKTRLGKAMRAVPQDRDAAVLYGINVNFIITVTFAIGSALAAVAALMYCSTYPRVTNDMGSMMGIKAFIAAVLGGIGVIPGAMLGGILIGLIEIFVKLFAPGWYEAVTYGLLIVILLVKPSGILGKNAGEKV
jgi:branched-chain amino acid transport system permease protein